MAEFGSLLSQIGGSLSLGLCAIGAAYGTAKTGVGISATLGGDSTRTSEEKHLLGATPTPRLDASWSWKAMVPIVIAGVIAIYGLIIAVIINAKQIHSLEDGFACFGAGLSMGLSGLASGVSIGTFGVSAVQTYARQPSFFVQMVLILIFAEAIGLYGMVMALIGLSKF